MKHIKLDPNPKIRIELYSDGWVIWVGNKRYRWDHNDIDLGTATLEVLFKDLGLDVEFEEVY